MGIITLFRTVSALAPGKVAVTLTVGGAISGYWVIGNEVIPKIPSMTIRMEMTVDKTGLSINFLSIIYILLFRMKSFFSFEKLALRSEERRVGKEFRYRLTQSYHKKKDDKREESLI